MNFIFCKLRKPQKHESDMGGTLYFVLIKLDCTKCVDPPQYMLSQLAFDATCDASCTSSTEVATGDVSPYPTVSSDDGSTQYTCPFFKDSTTGACNSKPPLKRIFLPFDARSEGESPQPANIKVTEIDKKSYDNFFRN